MPSSPHSSWDASSPCMIYPESPLAPGRVTTPRGDLRYINLSGPFLEAASEAGSRMSEAMRRGALSSLSRGLHTTLDATRLSRVAPLIEHSTRRLVTHRLQQRLPHPVIEAMTQMADASGIPRRTLIDAHLMPETLLWFSHTIAQPPLSRPMPQLLDATSLLLAASEDGRPLLGHDLNYLGANYWERYTTLTAYHPPNGHSFVAVTTAGLLGAGLTAMNSAGLVLLTHPLHVQGVHTQGAPVGMITDAVMRRAATLEQAIDLLRHHRPVTPFGFLLLEGDTGRVLIDEYTPDTRELVRLSIKDAPLFYHDTPITPRLDRVRLPSSPANRLARERRRRRLADLVRLVSQPDSPPHDPLLMARLLGDMHDFSLHDTPHPGMTGSQVAHANTLSSAIFDPARRQLWVAAGKSPSSRGWFIPFTLHPRSLRPTPSLTPFTAFPDWPDSLHGQAYESYRQACYRIHEGDPPAKLSLLLEHALAQWPHDADLQVACGLLAMKAGRIGRAHGALDRALDQETDPARRAEIRLYLAMSLDLKSGSRNAAKDLYKQVIDDPAAPSPIVALAKKKRWRRLKEDELEELPLDLHVAGLTL